MMMINLHPDNPYVNAVVVPVSASGTPATSLIRSIDNKVLLRLRQPKSVDERDNEDLIRSLQMVYALAYQEGIDNMARHVRYLNGGKE